MPTAPALDLVPAGEAAARLGVSRASLYAYVSRGLIRSFAAPRDPRQRLYAAQDVEALVTQRQRLRRPRVAAATALDWGLPVLDTGITQIRDGRLFYRGQDALALAESASFEEVARLLVGSLRLPRAPGVGLGVPASAQEFLARAITQLAEHGDAGSPAEAAGRILHAMARAAGDRGPADRPMHARLAAAWQAGGKGEDAIRRALVLSADHEMSPSAFAVRVVASTGAGLDQAVIAGLAALSGVRHGGATDVVRTLFEEGRTPSGARRVLARARDAGHPVGFRHPLYPEGDPRGPALLRDLPLSPADARLLRLITEAHGHPSLDVGLVLLERAHGLPAGAAFMMFAIGRTAGWLAHALEQRASGSLIRPRARYVVVEEAP